MFLSAEVTLIKTLKLRRCDFQRLYQRLDQRYFSGIDCQISIRQL